MIREKPGLYILDEREKLSDGREQHLLGIFQFDRLNRLIIRIEFGELLAVLQNSRTYGRYWIDIDYANWDTQNKILPFKIGKVSFKDIDGLKTKSRYILFGNKDSINIRTVNKMGYVADEVLTNTFEFKLLQANIRKYYKK